MQCRMLRGRGCYFICGAVFLFGATFGIVTALTFSRIERISAWDVRAYAVNGDDAAFIFFSVPDHSPLAASEMLSATLNREQDTITVEASRVLFNPFSRPIFGRATPPIDISHAASIVTIQYWDGSNFRRLGRCTIRDRKVQILADE